jgi:hypothetical protein
MNTEIEIQRQYYAQTANSYDEMHLEKDQQHILALISEGDGLVYSYSVYQSFRTLRKFWKTLRITSTSGSSDTLLGSIISAEQVLLVALDKKYEISNIFQD